MNCLHFVLFKSVYFIKWDKYLSFCFYISGKFLYFERFQFLRLPERIVGSNFFVILSTSLAFDDSVVDSSDDDSVVDVTNTSLEKVKFHKNLLYDYLT